MKLNPAMRVGYIDWHRAKTASYAETDMKKKATLYYLLTHKCNSLPADQLEIRDKAKLKTSARALGAAALIAASGMIAMVIGAALYDIDQYDRRLDQPPKHRWIYAFEF